MGDTAKKTKGKVSSAKGKKGIGKQGKMKGAKPVVLGKREFLESFETGNLQKRLAGYLESLGFIVSDCIRRSWNNSYAFLDIVLRDDEIPDSIEVLCEYPVNPSTPRTSKRADAVLVWPAIAGEPQRRAIVVELKQWDQFCLTEEIEDGKESSLDNPFDQAREQASILMEQGYDGDRVWALPCAYLHNMPLEESGAFDILENRHEDVAGFYLGQVEELRNFIKSAAPCEALSPTDAIKRARKQGYWSDNLPGSPRGLRDALIAKKYARPLLKDRYDFEPTAKGSKLGIVRYEGYNEEEKHCFVICKFTDKSMRKIAKRLAKE